MPGDFATIQAAIDSGAAGVEIAPGTYQEQLTIPGNVVLCGNGVTVENTASGTNVLDVTGTGFIEGVTFRGRSRLLNGTLTGVGVTFRDSWEDGFYNTSGTSYFLNSTATANNNDGFDYNGSAKGLEVNSFGINNGTGPNDNGSTAHQTSTTIRINGTYTGNYRNLHDVHFSNNLIINSTANTSVGASNPNDSFNLGAGFQPQNPALHAVKTWVYGGNLTGGANVDYHTDQNSEICIDQINGTQAPDSNLTEVEFECVENL